MRNSENRIKLFYTKRKISMSYNVEDNFEWHNIIHPTDARGKLKLTSLDPSEFTIIRVSVSRTKSGTTCRSIKIWYVWYHREISFHRLVLNKQQEHQVFYYLFWNHICKQVIKPGQHIFLVLSSKLWVSPRIAVHWKSTFLFPLLRLLCLV